MRGRDYDDSGAGSDIGPGPAARGAQSWETTQSMLLVSCVTSSGSMAGNMPMRSWLRPSLRYGSVSTMPLARRIFATCAASTESAKSTVPTTCERSDGSATNGVAYSDASAHSYRREDESFVRATAQSRPPLLLSHSIWLANSSRVASAGVL